MPMAALRQVLLEVSPFIQDKPLAWLCKGFEAARVDASAADALQKGIGWMAHEVCAQVAPGDF